MVRYTDEVIKLGAGIPPWHMWGSTVELATLGAIANVERASQQIARVSYKRPENWRFWIQARLVGGDAPAVGPEVVRIRVDLAFGVGRSVARTHQPVVAGVIQTAFAFFEWLVPIGVLPQDVPNSNKYTTQVRTPELVDGDATTITLCDHFPAENIQAEANLVVLKAEAIAVQTEVTVFFAPNVHVRPDWLDPEAPAEAMFRGGETGGT